MNKVRTAIALAKSVRNVAANLSYTADETVKLLRKNKSIPISELHLVTRMLKTLVKQLESRLGDEKRAVRLFCEGCGQHKQRIKHGRESKSLVSIQFKGDLLVLCSDCISGLRKDIRKERKGWRKYKHLAVVPQKATKKH